MFYYEERNTKKTNTLYSSEVIFLNQIPFNVLLFFLKNK